MPESDDRLRRIAREEARVVLSELFYIDWTDPDSVRNIREAMGRIIREMQERQDRRSVLRRSLLEHSLTAVLGGGAATWLWNNWAHLLAGIWPSH